MYVRADSFEEYLTEVGPTKVETIKIIIDKFREKIPEAEERVRWSIAIARKDETDLIGISARKDFYSLYIPHQEIISKYSSRLGKVQPGHEAIRFKSIDDLDMTELDNLLEELKQKAN